MKKLLVASEFYGDLVYRIRKIMGKSNFFFFFFFSEQFRKIICRYKIIGFFFSEQFRKIICRYKIIGYLYIPYIERQTACLVVNPINVDSYSLLFNFTAMVRPQTQRRPLHKAFSSGLELNAMSLVWPLVIQLVVFFNSGSQWA